MLVKIEYVSVGKGESGANSDDDWTRYRHLLVIRSFQYSNPSPQIHVTAMQVPIAC